MRPFYKIFLLFFVLVFVTSCTKNEDIIEPSPTNFTDPSEYLPLKTGNYWIFQTYSNNGSQSGTLRPTEYMDSTYVGSDTIINGLKHTKIYSMRYELLNGQKSNIRTYLLASLRTKDSRMIHGEGGTYFSTDTIIKAHYATEAVNNKTVYTITGKAKYIPNVNLPIGIKDALKWEVVHFTDKSISTSGNDEFKEDSSIYFVKGIGFATIVINGDLYPSNNIRFEKQLIRYSVN